MFFSVLSFSLKMQTSDLALRHSRSREDSVAVLKEDGDKRVVVCLPSLGACLSRLAL